MPAVTFNILPEPASASPSAVETRGITAYNCSHPASCRNDHSTTYVGTNCCSYFGTNSRTNHGTNAPIQQQPRQQNRRQILDRQKSQLLSLPLNQQQLQVLTLKRQIHLQQNRVQTLLQHQVLTLKLR